LLSTLGLVVKYLDLESLIALQTPNSSQQGTLEPSSFPTKKAMSIWGVPPVGNIGWMNRGAMRVLAYAPLMA